MPTGIYTRTKEHRNKIGLIFKGRITEKNKQIRNSLEYSLWRTAVFVRDQYTCQNCGDKSGNGHTVSLEADHIKPFAFFPELRLAIDNGRTLCRSCHMKTDTWGRPSKMLEKVLQ